MKIGAHEIGAGHPPFIVAEIGASHNGKLGNALDLIKAAQECGADAAKVQFYRPSLLARQRAGMGIIWHGEPMGYAELLALYAQAETPIEWFPQLFGYAARIGIELFTSVFHTDDPAFRFFEAWRCPAYKISSYEVSDRGLIGMAAATGKPILISTGNREPETVAAAYAAALREGARETAILHCVSKYPCPTDEAEIERISELRNHFPIVGFSDHTMGSEAAIAALKQGAVIFEKHIKLWGDTTSPDSGFASTPGEFADYVMAIRKAAKDAHQPLVRKTA